MVLEGAVIEDDDVGVGAGVHLGELLPSEGQRLVVPDNRWIKIRSYSYGKKPAKRLQAAKVFNLLRES